MTPAESNTRLLLADFAACLDYIEKGKVFGKPNQLGSHARTMKLRRELGSARAAVESDSFLDSLHETLHWWGCDGRVAMLVDRDTFRRELWDQRNEISPLDLLQIDSADEQVGEAIWRIVRRLSITLTRRTSQPTKSKIVCATKALHHLLPELVVPIDRENTGFFVGRRPPQFQPPHEEKTYWLAFRSFLAIAKAANPVQYVDRHPWHTSRTKVIDNAIVGFVTRLKEAGRAQFRAQ